MKYDEAYIILTGPLLWTSLVLFLAGILFRAGRMVMLSGPVAKPVKKGAFLARAGLSVKERAALAWKNSMPSRDPLLAVVSLLFHTGLISSPLFLTAHNVMLFQSWGWRIFSFPAGFSGFLTMMVLSTAVLLLLRRMTMRRVRLISTTGDYIMLILATAPFVTGLLARIQAGHYEMMLLLHVISGEVLIVALGWTGLSHPVFFIFTRFFIRSEYSLRNAARSWRYGL